MDGITVHCPLGDCHGAIRLRRGVGVYFLEAFGEDPRTPIGYRGPEPAATVGGDRFVDERHRRALVIECTDGHFLRLHLAEESVVGPEECLYGPARTTTVRCPTCEYGFGEYEEFRLTVSAPTERTHELTSITDTAPPAYADVAELSRATLTEHDRFAHRQSCPNCGTLVAFNYDRR